MPNTETVNQTVPAGFPMREDRRPVALTGWLIRSDDEDQAHDFSIDNLSYGGCRMQSAARLVRGDKVHLNVLRRGAIPGVVRWHNAYGIGVSFTPQPPDRIEKPRKGERVGIEADLMVRQAGRRGRFAPASDLSRFGCCVMLDDLPTEGEWVWVAMPGLTPIQARVRWTEGRRAGVEFVHPIHASVFDALLQRCGIGTA